MLETEDIIALNAAWLRGQEDLLVLDDEELDRHIAERVARIPNLAERQAEAAEDALLDAPEFELTIRELCDVAGHTLQKITMGDPNYEHNGERTLAWHFTTDQGEFLMVEDDDEAFMIHPDTKEIVAAVEFEEAYAAPSAGAAAPGSSARRCQEPAAAVIISPDGATRYQTPPTPWPGDVAGGLVLGVVVDGHAVDGQLLLAVGRGDGSHGAGDAARPPGWQRWW